MPSSPTSPCESNKSDLKSQAPDADRRKLSPIAIKTKNVQKGGTNEADSVVTLRRQSKSLHNNSLASMSPTLKKSPSSNPITPMEPDGLTPYLNGILPTPPGTRKSSPITPSSAASPMKFRNGNLGTYSITSPNVSPKSSQKLLPSSPSSKHNPPATTTLQETTSIGSLNSSNGNTRIVPQTNSSGEESNTSDGIPDESEQESMSININPDVSQFSNQSNIIHPSKGSSMLGSKHGTSTQNGSMYPSKNITPYDNASKDGFFAPQDVSKKTGTYNTSRDGIYYTSKDGTYKSKEGFYSREYTSKDGIYSSEYASKEEHGSDRLSESPFSESPCRAGEEDRAEESLMQRCEATDVGKAGYGSKLIYRSAAFLKFFNNSVGEMTMRWRGKDETPKGKGKSPCRFDSRKKWDEKLPSRDTPSLSASHRTSLSTSPSRAGNKQAKNGKKVFPLDQDETTAMNDPIGETGRYSFASTVSTKVTEKRKRYSYSGESGSSSLSSNSEEEALLQEDDEVRDERKALLATNRSLNKRQRVANVSPTGKLDSPASANRNCYSNSSNSFSPAQLTRSSGETEFSVEQYGDQQEDGSIRQEDGTIDIDVAIEKQDVAMANCVPNATEKHNANAGGDANGTNPVGNNTQGYTQGYNADGKEMRQYVDHSSIGRPDSDSGKNGRKVSQRRATGRLTELDDNDEEGQDSGKPEEDFDKPTPPAPPNKCRQISTIGFTLFVIAALYTGFLTCFILRPDPSCLRYRVHTSGLSLKLRKQAGFFSNVDTNIPEINDYRKTQIAYCSVFHVLVVILLAYYGLAGCTSPGRIPNTKKWRNGEFETITTMLEKLEKSKIISPEQFDNFELPREYRSEIQCLEVKDDGSKRFCKWCGLHKPDRAHHCRVCQSCSLKMDHHCPWLGNCVGHSNHKHFLNLLIFASITSWFMFIVQLNQTLAMFGWDFLGAPVGKLNTTKGEHKLSDNEYYNQKLYYGTKSFYDETTGYDIIPLALKIWSVISSLGQFTIAIIMTLFFSFHMYLIQNGMTTLEYYEKHRHGVLKVNWKRTPWKNCTSVWGHVVLGFCCPFGMCASPGDGTRFVGDRIPENMIGAPPGVGITTETGDGLQYCEEVPPEQMKSEAMVSKKNGDVQSMTNGNEQSMGTVDGNRANNINPSNLNIETSPTSKGIGYQQNSTLDNRQLLAESNAGDSMYGNLAYGSMNGSQSNFNFSAIAENQSTGNENTRRRSSLESTEEKF